ncbi:flagellar basal-body rod protein FlgG [Brevibacillus halotolerans]|uniref:Flagellar basal body rod protein FlgG n=1 Tax=Brevibacillus laterosporus TaxID=1465 RepID=A0A0F6XZY0_BRELA|nr:flagellar basal body rod protein FlgG [Brevibacillus halotolerans]AKF94561.1 flagellar basal body rod protein FlgG [Brevibacillus laterosporus]GIO00735.1 flagellar basal-body rod protein FlgG [Brevibacillus halotolerans]
MIRSMYSGVSGMKGFQTKLDVIGNNIANVNTVGFKKSRVMFQDILSQKVGSESGPTENGARGSVNPKQVGLGSTVAAINVVHSVGSPMTTNLTSDLSIEGDGFFVVSDGDNKYLTRAGNFERDVNGFLVNPQGMKLLDSGGNPVQIERENVVSYSIGSDGVITTVDNDQQVQEAATIGLVTVPNPGGLEKVGGSLFKATVASGNIEMEPTTPTEANSKILSGQLEMSNVDLSEEFTEMIVAQRGFQANSRIITTSDTVLEELINLKR